MKASGQHHIAAALAPGKDAPSQAPKVKSIDLIKVYLISLSVTLNSSIDSERLIIIKRRIK